MQSITSFTKHLAKTSFIAMILGASALPAIADFIEFDPDGGGNAGKLSIGAFQFGAGNSLARAALPFTVNTGFQLLLQAQLNSLVTSTGAQVTPEGLNAPGTIGGVAPYEITVVLSATEFVKTVSSKSVQFVLNAVQAGNSFVEVYYDPNQNANPLAGTGYNDGLLILRATPKGILSNTGTFSRVNPQPSPAGNFDSFGFNDYATAGPGAECHLCGESLPPRWLRLSPT
jgi:hypothetical protein